MTDSDMNRKIRNLRISLTRRARCLGTAAPYVCRGGPFDGQDIFLRTGSTVDIKTADHQGRYLDLSTISTDRSFHQDRHRIPTVTWLESA